MLPSLVTLFQAVGRHHGVEVVDVVVLDAQSEEGEGPWHLGDWVRVRGV